MLERTSNGIAILRVLNPSLTTKNKTLLNLKEIIDIQYVLAGFLSPQELCRLSMTSRSWLGCIDGVCWQQCVLNACRHVCSSPSARRILSMPSLVWKDVWKIKWMCECVASVGDLAKCMEVMRLDPQLELKVKAAFFLSRQLEERAATVIVCLDCKLVAAMIAEALHAITQDPRQYSTKTRSLGQNLKINPTLASYLLCGQLDAITLCKMNHDELRDPPVHKMVMYHNQQEDVPYVPPAKRIRSVEMAQ